MNEVEMAATVRVAKKMKTMAKAWSAIKVEAASGKDAGGCVNAGRRLERIHEAAKGAISVYYAEDSD